MNNTNNNNNKITWPNSQATNISCFSSSAGSPCPSDDNIGLCIEVNNDTSKNITNLQVCFCLNEWLSFGDFNPVVSNHCFLSVETVRLISIVSTACSGMLVILYLVSLYKLHSSSLHGSIRGAIPLIRESYVAQYAWIGLFQSISILIFFSLRIQSPWDSLVSISPPVTVFYAFSMMFTNLAGFTMARLFTRYMIAFEPDIEDRISVLHFFGVGGHILIFVGASLPIASLFVSSSDRAILGRAQFGVFSLVAAFLTLSICLSSLKASKCLGEILLSKSWSQEASKERLKNMIKKLTITFWVVGFEGSLCAAILASLAFWQAAFKYSYYIVPLYFLSVVLASPALIRNVLVVRERNLEHQKSGLGLKADSFPVQEKSNDNNNDLPTEIQGEAAWEVVLV